MAQGGILAGFAPAVSQGFRMPGYDALDAQRKATTANPLATQFSIDTPIMGSGSMPKMEPLIDPKLMSAFIQQTQSASGNTTPPAGRSTANIEGIFGPGWQREQSKITAADPNAAAALTWIPRGAADDWLRTMGVRRVANGPIFDYVNGYAQQLHNWQNWGGPGGVLDVLRQFGWRPATGGGWMRDQPYEMDDFLPSMVQG